MNNPRMFTFVKPKTGRKHVWTVCEITEIRERRDGQLKITGCVYHTLPDEEQARRFVRGWQHVRLEDGRLVPVDKGG